MNATNKNTLKSFKRSNHRQTHLNHDCDKIFRNKKMKLYE